MTVTSLGIIGGFAATPFSQRAAEADKLPGDAADRTRATEATDRAENAAGIGQTEEDAEASERDADGRRPWERPEATTTGQPEQSALPVPQRSKDPTGTCGQSLDLTG